MRYPLYIEEDIKAIRKCDLFIMYNTNKKTSGKFIELGMAIILNKPILIYGKDITSMFKSRTQYCGEFNIQKEEKRWKLKKN